jgi:hypothetical protein
MRSPKTPNQRGNQLSFSLKIRKKAFQQFKKETEAQQSESHIIDKIDNAVSAEEYKQMQNLLQPIQQVTKEFRVIHLNRTLSERRNLSEA